MIFSYCCSSAATVPGWEELSCDVLRHARTSTQDLAVRIPHGTAAARDGTRQELGVKSPAVTFCFVAPGASELPGHGSC